MQPDQDLLKLFSDLVRFTSAVVDPRYGEAHIPCPRCGHASSIRNPHCSFSARGWKCFSCGNGGSLVKLAEEVKFDLGGSYRSVAAAPKPIQRTPATWLSDAERLVCKYEAHPQRFNLWQSYKPVSYSNIIKNRLGVGVLPVSKCHHERLIVPIIDGSMIVGIRGRALGCDCGKWLAPGGTLISMYPLYNQEALKPGAVVWIVENPIDALLVGQASEFVGAATFSVAYWEEAWTKALCASRPELVIVAYDNDLSGNGGACRRSDLVRAWQTKHPGLSAPQPAGPKLTNRLLEAGLKAILFDWGKQDVKDIGVLIGNSAVAV